MSTKRYAAISIHLLDNDYLDVGGTIIKVLSYKREGTLLDPKGHSLVVLVEEDA